MSRPATTKLCKLCHERSDFVNAHIVPSSFYPEVDRGKEALLLLSNNPNIPIKRSKTGIYDRELVCAGCEKIFDPYDDYAAKVLLDGKVRHQLVMHNGKPLIYQAGAFNYPKLKLFLLSVLWRAAESARPEFAKVDVGTYLAELSTLVKQGEPGDPGQFGGFICRFSDVESWGSGFISPFSELYEGINFYRFVTGTYIFYIKVDPRPAPASLSSLFLRPGVPLTIIAREFHNGPESRAFLRLARMNAAKRTR